MQYLFKLIFIFTITGAIIYLADGLDARGSFLSIIFGLTTFWFLRKSNSAKIQHLKIKLFAPESLLFLAFTGLSFYELLTAKSDQALVSPWQVVDPIFFVFYGMAFFTLIFAINKAKKEQNTILSINILIFISVLYFIAFSVVVIVYKIGYGFDPFIHQASLKYISEHGAVEPKTIYYAGQYGLESIIHLISRAPFNLIDKFLMPILAALLLPYAFYAGGIQFFKSRKTTLLATLGALTIVFSPFIFTVPQNLAYLFLLLTIILARRDMLIATLASGAALTVHPIAGFGATLFIASEILHKLPIWAWLKKVLNGSLYASGAIALPAALFLSNKENIEFNSKVLQFFNWPSIPDGSNIFLNFTYFYGNNVNLIIFSISILGLILARKNIVQSGFAERCGNWFIFFMLGALGVSLFSFNSLIAYEQSNYAQRVMIAASFFLLPYLAHTAKYFLDKAKKMDLFTQISIAVFASILACASLYITYPRWDFFHNSRGYSVSVDDLKIAEFIQNDAQNTDYFVLANQSSSAAALYQYGFSRYFTNEKGEKIFYYPIPTGGKLYQIYLKMVDENPSRANMQKAAELTGARLGYFVLNDYWWNANSTKSTAILSSDEYVKIGSNAVFRYDLLGKQLK